MDSNIGTDADSEDDIEDYNTFYIFGIKFALWYFVISLNILLLIISFILYKITFFHGYQVSLDKTLDILQAKSSSGVLIESKKEAPKSS